MFRTVLVPLDGSPYANRAVPFASRLCAAGGAIVLLRAVLDPSQLVVTNAAAARIAAARQRAAVREAEQDLSVIAERIRAEGIDVATRVEQRDAARAILQTATEVQADLIVMATHGRPAPLRAVLGSVAEEVLRRSRAPLLLIPPHCQKPWPEGEPLCALVALDGSPLAEHALGPAVSLAAALDAELLLLRVAVDEALPIGETEEQYLERVRKSLQDRLARVRVMATTGSPSDRILEVARQEPAHVIAMATHGRSGIARLLMGSVTTDVLHRSDVPVLLVGPTAIGLIPEGAPFSS